MKIAITGATGFVGRELVAQLKSQAIPLKCWYRPESHPELQALSNDAVEWVAGQLADRPSAERLVDGCDVVVHAALYRSGKSFREGAGADVVEFARQNILGTLELIEAAIAADVKRFVFVSTCAVHEKILDDRPLDESHPLWALTHYGAHKAAIEKFVHSYGFGQGFPICAIRPTGIYGVADPVTDSKWYSLVKKVATGADVEVGGGGKEVNVVDVARAIQLLINAKAEAITGESFACYDRYISQYEVATIAKRMSGSRSQIIGEPKKPKHEIDTTKIRNLGMAFGGTERLEATIRRLLG